MQQAGQLRAIGFPPSLHTLRHFDTGFHVLLCNGRTAFHFAMKWSISPSLRTIPRNLRVSSQAISICF